jgi:hypothetical protein
MILVAARRTTFVVAVISAVALFGGAGAHAASPGASSLSVTSAVLADSGSHGTDNNPWD